MKTTDITKSPDFFNAIEIMRWTFYPLGIWPLKSPMSPCVRNILVGLTILLLLNFLVPGALYLVLIEKDLGLRMKLLAPVTFTGMNSFKYFVLLMKNQQFNQYLTSIALDWYTTVSQEDRNIMLARTKTSRTVMTFCLFGLYACGLAFCTILPLSRPSIVFGNKSYRHLPLDSYYVMFYKYKSPYHDIVFVFNCVGAFLVYTINSGVCNMSIHGITHISSRCEITSLMIQQLTRGFTENLFGQIISYHCRSIKIIYMMQNILNEIYLVEFTGCSLILCLLGYYLIMDFQSADTAGLITYTGFFIMLTFNIFVFCYLGEHLTEQFTRVGSTVYTIDWYNLSVKKSRNLLLIVLFTQRPIVLTAGKIMIFSLPSFTNVMKASATYLNMLRTMTYH